MMSSVLLMAMVKSTEVIHVEKNAAESFMRIIIYLATVRVHPVASQKCLTLFMQIDANNCLQSATPGLPGRDTETGQQRRCFKLLENSDVFCYLMVTVTVNIAP